MRAEELLIVLCVIVGVSSMPVSVHVDDEQCDPHQYLYLDRGKCLPCKDIEDVCESDRQCCNNMTCSIHHSNNKTGQCCPLGSSWDHWEAACKHEVTLPAAGVSEAETTTTGQGDSSEPDVGASEKVSEAEKNTRPTGQAGRSKPDVGASEKLSSDLVPRDKENEMDTHMIWAAVLGAVVEAVIISVFGALVGAVYHKKLRRLLRWLLYKMSEDKTCSTEMWTALKESPRARREIADALFKSSDEETRDFVIKLLREDESFSTFVWTAVKKSPEVRHQIERAPLERSDEEIVDLIKKLLSRRG